MRPRPVPLLIAALVLTLVTACGGRDGVPESRGEPVPRASIEAPTYAALGMGIRMPGGSRVVAGARSTRVPDTVTYAAWLSSGDVLLGDGRRAWVLDPRSGRRVASVPYGDGPVASAGRVAVVPYGSRSVRVYDDRLRLLRTIEVPASAADTDQTGEGATFSIGRPVVVGGAVWVHWYVDSEDDERTDHGVLRVAERGRRFVDVARNRPVVRLYPASDGRALLADVRDRGQNVSCQACGGDDHVEEWDVRTGEATDLGKPPGFDEWNVLAMDKIVHRFVVRYRIPGGEGTRSVQTWVRDDDGWREERSLRDRVVWEQDGDTLVQTLDIAKDRGDGAPYTLRIGARTLLTPARACHPRRALCLEISAPGRMLPAS